MAAGFDLETTDRLLSTTRAVRRRLDLGKPVERSVLLDCIALSQQAPTASNRQHWRWLIVEDADTRAAIAEIYARVVPFMEKQRETEADPQTQRVYDSARYLVDHLAHVPVHVIPCVEGRPPEQFSNPLCAMTYGSIFQAVWSFQLALRSRGLGSCFTTAHLAWESELAELLGIPDDVLQVALLPVAYTVGTDFRRASRPAPETITSFDHWEGRA